MGTQNIGNFFNTYSLVYIQNIIRLPFDFKKIQINWWNEKFARKLIFPL